MTDTKAYPGAGALTAHPSRLVRVLEEIGKPVCREGIDYLAGLLWPEALDCGEVHIARPLGVMLFRSAYLEKHSEGFVVSPARWAALERQERTQLQLN